MYELRLNLSENKLCLTYYMTANIVNVNVPKCIIILVINGIWV